MKIDPAMSSTSSEAPVKDRKQSAHWTDEDTETLVAILLRVKDTARTSDNGFKPEVWQEASEVLQRATFMGGAKTAEACKSRWQRLQRDYRAAKVIEAMPGFKWDSAKARLDASPEAWIEAEKQLDSYKYRKIYLPCFESLAILCDNDPSSGIQRRVRATKPRQSQASMSSSSSMMNLSGGTPQKAPRAPRKSRSQGHAHSQSLRNGHGADGVVNPQNLINGAQEQHEQQQQPPPQQPPPQQQQQHVQVHGMGGATAASGSNANQLVAQLQGQLQQEHNVFSWEEPQDGEGEFDGSFSLANGTQPFSMPQKRQLPFDTSLLAGPSQPPAHTLPMTQGSPSKRLRPNAPRQLPGQMANSHPHMQAPSGQPFTYQLPASAPNSNGNGNGTPQPQPPSHAHPHAHPHAAHARQHDHSGGGQAGPSQGPSHTQDRSPEFPGNATPMQLDPAMLQTSPALPLKQFSSSGPSAQQSPHAPLGLPMTPLSAEVVSAGLTEAQRRTEALLQLQNLEVDMRDEDMVEIMAEFECNVAAADTYMAIKREGLRRLWLVNIVRRRRNVAT